MSPRVNARVNAILELREIEARDAAIFQASGSIERAEADRLAAVTNQILLRHDVPLGGRWQEGGIARDIFRALVAEHAVGQ